MHKTSESTPVTQTPKSRNPKSGQPKKKSSQKTVGQKWFKGTPKSRSSKKLLKSSPVDKTPQKAPTPAGYVEFELDGIAEKFSIYEAIVCGTADEFEHEGLPKCNLFGTPEPTEEVNDVVNSGKLKSTKKVTDGFKRGKTPKSGKNKTKTPETETKKKIDKVCKLPEANYEIIKNYNTTEAPPLPVGYIRYMETSQEELADEVEYDLDGEDNAWLQFVNDKRKQLNVAPVKFADMEFLMDRLEKESYFQMQSTGGIDQGALIDDDAVCCICMDGECQNSNAILFCDMCNLAVHQECYGVPYIPEGQWLCRRCLQSPSRAVDCALCPNKGGAFKQTDDGRWAHVVCAIWIPEVCFANTVFLEPVDSIGNIPPARWRLVCFICQQRGVGACIQCHKSNCYTAFHVTCAQQAGLCMKMDTVKDSTSVQVKKTAYCHNHAPPDSDFAKDGGGAPRQKMKQARKVLAEKRSAVPVLSIPTIPEERMTEISQMVSFPRKNQFIKRLMAYWKLKRQSRNGVPLLRRLQASSSVPHPKREGHGSAESKTEESQVLYRYWLRLRQDLERARLLCELVRKREKVKKELIHLKCREMDMRLRPFSVFLLNVLEEISSKDIQGFFQEPVDVTEVPDYLDIVKCPMDLSRIKEKVLSFEYNNLDEFESDFQLMIENCLSYNAKDTIFYRAALRLQELGGIILRHARRSVDAIGFDSQTGLHLPERNHHQSVMSDEEIIRKVESFLNDASRFSKPFDEHLNLLNEILDDTLNLNNPVARKKKFGRVKQEIVRVRRLKHSKGNKLSSKSPLKEKYKMRDSRRDSVEESESGARKTRLRGSVSQSSTNDVARSAPQQERRSQRGAKRKADTVEDEDSPPPSPPVLRNSTAPSARKDELDVTPAKRSRRLSLVDKDADKPSDMKLRSSVSSNAFGPTTVDSASKTRTSRSTPRMTSPTSSSRKGSLLNSPRLNVSSTAQNNSPSCKKRVFCTTPVKATPRKTRSPSQRHTLDIKEDEEEEMEVEVPRLRNSTRTKKTSNNAMTINNNVISCRNATWSGKNVFNESSGNNQKTLSNQSSWSSPSKSKPSFGNENEEGETSPRSKKKPGGIFADVVKADPPNTSDFDRQSLPASNCTIGSKPDNFSVYRSAAHDVDLNSDDEDDKDRDEDANGNSDTEESSESEEESADEAQDVESETENSEDEVSDNEMETNTPPSGEEISDGEVLPVRHLNTESHPSKLTEPTRKNNRAVNDTNSSNSIDVPDDNSYREDSEDAGSPVSVDGTPSLRSLDTVWAKSQDEWYPAMIIDPEMPNCDESSGLAIPVPPEDVLSCKPHGSQVQYLVLTFENKGAWKWIPQSHLEPLGQDPAIDQCHLHNPDLDKRAQGALRKVFEKAIRQRNRWNGAN